MGLPTFVRGYGGGRLGVGRYVCLPPPEHSCTVHFDQTHYGSLYGSVAAPWVIGVPEVVVRGEPGPGGHSVGIKGGINGGDVGGGG